MKPFAILLLTLALLSGCGIGSSPNTYRPTPIFTSKSAPQGRTQSTAEEIDELDPLELQAAIMSFADTTNTRLAEVATMIESIGTPQARLTAARMMVYDLASNVEIAAGPYPGISLLDMIVVTSLRRMAWEDYWIPKVFGEQAGPALTVFRGVEKEIWDLAARIMNEEQLNELARVILVWRERNPDKISVNYVRFDDFGDLGLKPSMRRLTVPGGLFASVKEATLVAQDMKVAIDRAFYLISRMQLLVNFQIKLAYLETMFQPESEGIITTTDKLAGISERYAEIAEKLPRELGDEASRLLAQISGDLNQQREAAISQTLSGITAWQDAMVTDVMTNVSRERQAALGQALEGLRTQQRELYEQVTAVVEKSHNDLEETLDHAFVLGLLLILAFFVALTAYKLLVSRPLGRRE